MYVISNTRSFALPAGPAGTVPLGGCCKGFSPKFCHPVFIIFVSIHSMSVHFIFIYLIIDLRVKLLVTEEANN